MDSEEAFRIADAAIFATTGKHLSDVQRVILVGSFEQQTYEKIAKEHRWSPEYLGQDAGPKFWKLLSQALGEKVSKNNFRAALLRRSRQPDVSPPLTSLNAAESEEPPSLWGAAPHSRQDWTAAPDMTPFYGREQQLEQLEQAIRVGGCRLVAIGGMAGIGKTALAAKLAQQVRDQFPLRVWRSLNYPPPVQDLIADLIWFLSDQQETSTELSRLLYYLTNVRCLLVLDGWEAVLGRNTHDGSYRSGYEGYGELLRQIGKVSHQSCLLLTSREMPREVVVMTGETPRVYSLHLNGLGELGGRELFVTRGPFSGSEGDWRELIKRYAGNPYALSIVATTVRTLFDGDISTFLEQLRQGSAISGAVRDLLDQHFDRLSDLERSIICCLTNNGEPITFTEILQSVAQPVPHMQLQEALQSLMRRSLIEVSAARYSVSTLVMEYVIYHMSLPEV